MDETQVSVGGTLRWVIEADTRQFDEGIQEAERQAQELKDTLDKNFGRTNDSFSGLRENTESATDLLKGLGKSALSGAFNSLALGATTATTAIATLVRKGVQGTDFLETARVSMAGLTGSIEEGNKAMSVAANFWQNNPFDRFTTTKATQQLIQFGRTTNQLASDLEILKQVSLSTNTPLDELSRFYARTAASGRAMTMDIELMSDRGIPIYRELAKQLQTTEAGVREFASEGKISFEIFRKALEGAVNPEAMAQFEDTLARQRDRLSGSISILAGDLAGYKVVNNELIISAQGLEKAYTKLLKTVATGLRNTKLREALEKIGYILADLVNKVADKLPPVFDALGNALNFVAQNSETLVPILGMTLLIFGRLGAQLPVVGGFLQNFATSINNVSGIIKRLYKEHSVLAIALTAIGIGFATAYKNSEEFRNAVASMLSSLSKLAKVLLPILQSIAQGFMEIASSDVVVGILTTVAQGVALLANALSSIPKEILTFLITAIGGLAIVNANPVIGLAMAIAIFVDNLIALGKALDVGKKIDEYIVTPFKNALEFLGNLPDTLVIMGKNVMMGLLNGIVSGAGAVLGTVKQIATNIRTTFAKALGIHSPSTVMAEQGKFIALGLAEGITDSKDVVQKAMDNLASDILSLASSAIDNRRDFGIIDYNGEYKDWKKVASMFTEGSKQYQTAIEKMEAARKNANLQIIKLQENYNDALDSTIQKYQNMYGLFQSVSFDGGLSSTGILTNLDNQVNAMQGWAASLEKISELGLDPRFVEELRAMGVDSADELAAIANMTEGELESLNSMWLRKQTIAENTAAKNLSGYREETLNQISQLKEGIDGETVDVQDIGGRLVANIGEGVTGAIPTLEEAFSKLDTYIAEAARSMASSGASAAADAASELTPDDYGGDTTASTIQKGLDDLQKNVVDGGTRIAQALGVIIPSLLALKTLAGRFMRARNQGGSIVESLKYMIGLGKKGTELSKTASEVSDMAKQTTSIKNTTKTVGQNIESTGQTVSKASKVMKTIREGAYTVIAIAAAIAAMAVAIRVAYEAIPDDIGMLAVKLGILAGTILAFGAISLALGWLSDKVGDIKKGLLLVAGVAADIVIASVAIMAMDALIPDDAGRVAWKMGIMVGTIAAMGLLAFIGGIAWEKIGMGLLLIAGVALDLILVAEGLRRLDEGIQSDFETMVGKLGVMGLAITEMGVLAGILGAVMSTGIGAVLLGAGLAAILGICAGIVEVAESIAIIDKKVPKNIDRVKTKVSAIGEVLKAMAKASFGNIIGNWFKSKELEQLADMAKYYAEVATLIDVINKVNISSKTVTRVERIRDAMYQMSQINEDVGNLSNKEWVAGMMSSIAFKMRDFTIAASEIKDVPDDLEQRVERVVKAIQVVSEIKADNKILGKLKTVAGVLEMAKKLPEFVHSLNDMGDVPNDIEDKMEKVRNVIVTIAKAFDGIKDDLGDATLTIDKGILSQSKANITKLGEIVQAVNGIGDFDEEASVGRIVALRRIVWEASQINGDVGDIGWKAWVVTATTSIIQNFKELAAALRDMGDVPDNAITKIHTLRDAVWEATHINEDVGNMSNKEWIVGMATSIVWKMKEFADAIRGIGNTSGFGEKITSMVTLIGQVADSVKEGIASKLEDMKNQGISIADKIREGVESQKENVANAGVALQSALWEAIEGKMNDEYEQGTRLGTKFKEGLESLKGQLRAIGEALQGDFWGGIESKMGDEYEQGRTLAGKVIEGINSRRGDFENAGRNAVEGFIQAVNGHNMYQSGWDAASLFLKGIKDKGEQGSPWRTTYESGQWAIEGMIEGIQSMETDLVNEAELIASSVVAAMSVEDAEISPSISTTGRVVAPVMGIDDTYSVSGRRRVVIEQTNNNYTQYSVAQANRDLAWLLSRA